MLQQRMWLASVLEHSNKCKCPDLVRVLCVHNPSVCLCLTRPPLHAKPYAPSLGWHMPTPCCKDRSLESHKHAPGSGQTKQTPRAPAKYERLGPRENTIFFSPAAGSKEVLRVSIRLFCRLSPAKPATVLSRPSVDISTHGGPRSALPRHPAD